MLKSMTGFGRGSASADSLTVVAEIKSINSRFLEFYLKMPDLLSQLEATVTALVKSRLSRGKIQLEISLSADTKTDIYEVFIDKPLVEKYLNSLKGIGKVSGETTFSDILALPDVLVLKPRSDLLERIETLVRTAVEGAIKSLDEMRTQEGIAIKKDIEKRIASINISLENLLEIRDENKNIYLETLRERIREILGNEIKIDEGRIAQEAALLAVKADQTEEIIRLKSHIKQLAENMALNESVGSKLRFILQEANREADTIGAKGDSAEVSAIVIAIKEELERIREQIQNVE